jgi:hypothetical protein
MTKPKAGAGDRLPEAVLTAIVSGREISLRGIDAPLVLIFHAQDTALTALEVNRAVRGVYPDAREVVIASVIDLRSFPTMFKGMVKDELEKAYHNSTSRLPTGADPADHVILLPDWKGTVHDALGVNDSNAQAAVVVADREGLILCRAQEGDLGSLALAALQEN